MVADESVDVRKSVVEQVFEALRVLHVSWIVALIAVAALALPAQVHDIYRMLAENLRRETDPTAAWTQIAIAVMLLALAAFLAFYVGRYRASVYRLRVGEEDAVLASCLNWGPAICGALIIAGAALGMYLSKLDASGVDIGMGPQIDRIIIDNRGAAAYLGWAALATAVGALAFLIAAYATERLAPAKDISPRAFAFDRPARLVWAVVAIGMTALAFFPQLSVPFSQWLGSLAIFLIFISVLLVGLSLLQTWSNRHRFPWSMALLAWGLLIAVLDLHKPSITLTERPDVLIPQVQARFVDWYEQRQDKEAFAGQPYPVFLVAAEAGGLYAAQFAAKVLTRLQDRCENFAQHVFAISGVSGGSLGASIFAALAKQNAPNGEWKPCKPEDALDQPGAMEQEADRVLGNDFLAPIVARGLFADLLQHFIPTRLPQFVAGYLPPGWGEPPDPVRRLLAQFSRGRALEETLEQAWAASDTAAAKGTANTFAEPFLGHWQPGDAAPALVLNTTSVSDGRLVFIAPFTTGGGTTGYDSGLLYNQPVFPVDKDLTLASAVGLSGRFPWVLPASTVGSDSFAVVDGAYFESSGIETLALMRRVLRPYEVQPEGEPDFPYIKVYVIIIGSFNAPVDASSLVLDEATPPIRTLLNARDRRGYYAYNTFVNWEQDLVCPPQRPEKQLEQNIACVAVAPVLFRLNYDYFNLPLGWTLSEGSSRVIDEHARGRCREGAELAVSDSDPRSILEQNRISADYIVPYFLSPKPAEGETSPLQPPC